MVFLRKIVDNAKTTSNTCHQCEKFRSKVDQLIKENENFQKKCEELLKENRGLKNQLFNSVCKNLNGKKKMKREQCEVCNEWLIEEEGHLCGDATEIRCEYCSASFDTITDFGSHLINSKHADMKMYKCKDCVKGFPAVALVKFHQESQYTHAVYSAIDEEMDISSVEKSNAFKFVLHDSFFAIFFHNCLYVYFQTVFKCSTCDSCFQQLNELKIHMRSHSKRNSLSNNPERKERRRISEFECYICRIKLSAKSEMKLHLKRHVAARDEKCVICEKSLTSKEMSEHLCYRQKSISCEYCSSSFSVTTQLVQHLEKHDDRMMRGCKKCSRFFAMGKLVVWHEKEHETERPRSFICDICSKGFHDKDKLRTHIKCHQITSKI